MSWHGLPVELKRKVFQYIHDDASKPSSRASCSVVCKGWQMVIEEKTLETLEVTPKCLYEFEKIFSGSLRRQGCLKHLWFRIELPTYSRLPSDTGETSEEEDTELSVSSDALLRLFTVLSKWDADQVLERNGRGINLELSAHSPSDQGNMSGAAGLTSMGEDRFLPVEVSLVGDELPSVSNVTGLSLLRRNMRRFRHTTISDLVACKLLRLDDIHLELWHHPSGLWADIFDSWLAEGVNRWAVSLKKINIFQHCETFQGPRAKKDATLARNIEDLGRRSHSLEELGLCNLIDARHFFESFSRPRATPRLPSWKNLRHLTLTSGLIAKDADSASPRDLLQSAATAAKRMPALHSLEIYNATTAGAGIFQYVILDPIAVINWASIWPYNLADDVKRAWKQVAQCHRLTPTTLEETLIHGYEGPAVFVHCYVVSRALVLHPSSSEAMIGDRVFEDPLVRMGLKRWAVTCLHKERENEALARITLSVNNPEVEEQELRLVTLEVFPDMTLGTLRSSIEAEGIPAPAQHLYHDGQLITDNNKTMQELSITDGDMLALHIRDMRGSGVAPGPREQPAAAPRRQASAPQDPELIRLQVLGDPRLRAELQRINPQLAANVDDSQRFAQLFQQSTNQQDEARRARMREIEALNNDEFNPEAQAKIEELIRQESVMENLQNAMEYNPESFGRVHLLYIDVKVNGIKVKALVDSGAQATIMSPSCAESCNIMRLVDRRFAGVARGVGTANIIGRVHYTMLQVGSKHLPASFTVMEGKAVDLLLGLDILKGHQATIDLTQNCLVIQGEKVEFLGESDIPKETEDAMNEEPTVQGPGGTTIGARSGAVTAPTTGSSSTPPAPAAAGPSSAAPMASRPAAPAAPAQPPAQAQPRRAFPEQDISTLIELGFDRQSAINALEATGGNVDYAAGLLFQN
ncbi:Uu.00g019040.m01.CDS01 [Anthostomella pinea]|uniref:DNA damage-inducible protein 1 n=1 Tax=Anthostomella pinea TaxID=933095 RepID=A0AAI8W042_9PEZI|nr:Uu.00g019040.m01.CDS01 [Anthostomella pinea]